VGVDGAEAEGWSAVADGWAELWGQLAEPAWSVVLESADLDRGASVLDVGCGSGDLLAYLEHQGFSTAGIDPAPGMVRLARGRAPGADIRSGGAEDLPWPDDSFDLVTAVNALQLADDTDDALAEMVRVTVPGGVVAVVNWAGSDDNDLDTLEAAVAEAAGDEPRPDGELRVAGGLERLLGDGGLQIVSSGIVEASWRAPDGDTLVRGVLLGEDAETIAETAPVVIAAAEPFRTVDGGYHLINRFRYAVGRTRG
jgi:SAM-dependent methyltransferase